MVPFKWMIYENGGLTFYISKTTNLIKSHVICLLTRLSNDSILPGTMQYAKYFPGYIALHMKV